MIRAAQKGSGMAIGRAVLGAVAGLVVGGVATFVIGLGAAEVFGISQAEGAYAMGLIFFWVPVGALVGLIAGAILGARRRR